MQMMGTIPSSLESQLADSALPVTHGECEHEARSSVQLVFVVQVPPVQVPLHVTPQPPQLLVSVPIVLTQLPLQQLSPPHGEPQPPQLFGSLVMSTHTLLQHVLAVPRQPPPQLVELVSGCVLLESLGGTPVSLGGVPESCFGLLTSYVPESVSTCSVPVAHAATQRNPVARKAHG